MYLRGGFLWQEEAQPHLHAEDLAVQTDHSSSASTSLEVEPSPEACSGGGRRSLLGLSGEELLKCAFPHPQAEGATEGPGPSGEHPPRLRLAPKAPDNREFPLLDQMVWSRTKATP